MLELIKSLPRFALNLPDSNSCSVNLSSYLQERSLTPEHLLEHLFLFDCLLRAFVGAFIDIPKRHLMTSQDDYGAKNKKNSCC